MANGTNQEDETSSSPSTDLTCNSPTKPVEACDIIPEVPSHVFVVEGGPPIAEFAKPGEEEIEQDEQVPKMAPLSTQEPKFSLTSLSSGASSRINVSPSKGFNILVLRDCLQSCLADGVLLDSYLDAYGEICKLLDSLGSVMRANIGRDIKQKIALMRRYRAGPNGEFYRTIAEMVTHEKAKGIPKIHPDENGSRTILILHRSLKFIVEFLKGLNGLRSEQNVARTCRDAYNRTLASGHQLVYRNVAKLAFHTLGKKGQLVANFHDGSMTPAQLKEAIDCVVNISTQVFTQCQAIYEKNNFLNLP